MHKYHYVTGDIIIRLWGDGREIGGRHPVVIGMSVISHELRLHGLSYHDPKDVYPIDQSHRYGRHQAACREPAGKL